MSDYYLDSFGSTDEYGIVSFTVDELCTLMQCGINIDNLIVKPHDEIHYVNQWLYGDNQHSQFTIYEKPDSDIDSYHIQNQNIWYTPMPWASMDIQEFLVQQCNSDLEIQRVCEEWILFEQHNLVPLLRHLKFLVDHFRSKNIVWGVGRGSSCASYCLYLIGVHKINSLKFNLNYREFFGE
jgi:hypothetical protein